MMLPNILIIILIPVQNPHTTYWKELLRLLIAPGPDVATSWSRHSLRHLPRFWPEQCRRHVVTFAWESGNEEKCHVMSRHLVKWRFLEPCIFKIFPLRAQPWWEFQTHIRHIV